MQRERDRLAGLNTAGFVSGYRGSPLGGLDLNLARAKEASRRLPHHLPARPQRGTRRDRDLGYAAGGTRAAKASMTAFSACAYGKGPGVDRSGDVFRHANMAGTSANGGVLAPDG